MCRRREDDLDDMPEWESDSVDNGKVLTFKNQLFQTAYHTFRHTPDKMPPEKYDAFCEQHVSIHSLLI